MATVSATATKNVTRVQLQPELVVEERLRSNILASNLYVTMLRYATAESHAELKGMCERTADRTMLYAKIDAVLGIVTAVGINIVLLAHRNGENIVEIVTSPQEVVAAAGTFSVFTISGLLRYLAKGYRSVADAIGYILP